MCGFGGVIHHPRELHISDVATIASQVGFRGPDSCGIRVMDDDLRAAQQGRHAIFFNRLAIIDTDHRSDQPFEDERYILAFNGEIYNYRELRSELEKKGRQFTTTSDTEVLFYCLREWGANAIPKLNGMFAFFWMDRQERKFIVARDRLGIKPLYFSLRNNSFIYSSELHSIIRLSGQPAEISNEAIDMYLWMQYVPTPWSAVKGINKLPPGHYISGNMAGGCDITILPFWDAYDYAAAAKPAEGKSLEEILRDSLKRQLHADVPLGLFLSSGVDSSLLAALVNKYFANGDRVDFFTVQFTEQTLTDESHDARAFIDAFKNPRLHCNTIDVHPGVIGDRLQQLYDFYDEPFGDHASLLNWMISEKAREFVTVAISGDGADELFWGYPRYQRWQKFGQLSRIPLFSPLARTAAQVMPEKVAGNIQFVLGKDPVERHFNLFLPSGMRFKIREPITHHAMWALQGVDRIAAREDLPAILDVKTYLADAMLYKVDRSSMASSLEVRVPYLDNEVVDYALAMPLAKKSTALFKSKAPLKELLLQLAPQYAANTTKKGFSFPLESWLKMKWRDQVLSTVTRQSLENIVADPDRYVRLVHDFYASKNNYFTDVWYIFNLCLWMKKIKSIGV